MMISSIDEARLSIELCEDNIWLPLERGWRVHQAEGHAPKFVESSVEDKRRTR